MEDKILTKEEYTEKLNELIKQIVDLATSTTQFNDTGCYSKEFVKVGDKEVTLAVIDNKWALLKYIEFSDLIVYRRMYHELQSEYLRLKEEYDSLKSHKKFMGIF